MPVIHPSESDTLTNPDSSGEKTITEKLEITSVELALSLSFYDVESVKEISVVTTLEFMPSKDRVNFFNQCYRILTSDGKMTVLVPYWHSWRSYYDPRFEWPPFCEQSFLCYNKEWRAANMKEFECETNFDFTYGYAWEGEAAARNDETRAFWTKHYANSVDALQLVFTKRNET